MTEQVKVTMRHIREAKMCASGAREFCRRHNIDWPKFLAEGIDAEELLKIDDALAHECVKVAKNGRR